MGQNRRQRRDAKQAPFRAKPLGSAVGQSEIIGLIQQSIRYAMVSAQAATPRIEQLNELGAVAEIPHLDPAALVVDEALSRIRQAWEYGWQPLDLVHAARRRTSAQGAVWVARAVLLQADRTKSRDRAPQGWAEQLDALASRHDGVDHPDALLAPRGRASVPEWVGVLRVLDFLHKIPPSEVLMPPPSAWGQKSATSQPIFTGNEQQSRTLRKVRALLAKAESTDFVAEAEAFTAKAQDLMTRHSIDEALLADGSGQSVDVRGVRILIDNPYALEKARLLDVVARANRTRGVWNDFSSCMTIMGVPTDLMQVEMLFTSLLVQATRAMTQAGQGSSGADRSTGFRKAFLTAYATRIGERLRSSTDEAVASYGSDLVPVFARQAEAIEQEFERLFPHITQGRSRTYFDARGWDAGTRAANDAVLPAGIVES